MGVNHRTAPLEALELLAVVGADLAGANRLLAERTGQAVVLHTCNRTEFYTLAEDLEEAREAAAGVLEEYGIDFKGVSPYVYAHHHDAAVRHLCPGDVQPGLHDPRRVRGVGAGARGVRGGGCGEVGALTDDARVSPSAARRQAGAAGDGHRAERAVG